MMRLAERVALITGAGSGIGRALALSLARRGCHLALADIDAQGVQETAILAKNAAPSGLQISTHIVDVASREQVAALPAAVMSAHGRIDLLFNNAGVAVGGLFEQVSEEDFDWLMEINFFGVVRMTRAFLPFLRQSDEARIVNISSIFGLISPPGQAAYSASKFAVRGFSNALRHELLGSTVGITVAHPGGIATAIAKSARAPAGISEVQLEKHRRQMQKMLRMPAQEAGEMIVCATEQRQARIIVGKDAQIGAWLERLMPVSYWNIMKKAMGA